MEPCKDTEMQSQTYRYSIPRLTEIGCKTTIAVDISRFTIEAIHGQSHSYMNLHFSLNHPSTFSTTTLTQHLLTAGVVTGPSVISKPLGMPLEMISSNRDRGWSVDSLESLEDRVVFPGCRGIHPRRQPRNAPSEARAQSDHGFARFLKQHSSPTHQRVTAGGRIVPMEPTPAPPQFNLLIDDLARGKDSNHNSQHEMITDPKIGNKRPVFIMNSNAASHAAGNATANADLQRGNSVLGQIGSAGQNHPHQVNTNAGGLKKGNLMPRPSDLTHVTSASTTGLPQPLMNVTSSFNLHPQTLAHNPWVPLSLPLPAMVFDSYTSMLVPSGEQNPMMPTSIMPTAPVSAVSGADQMTGPVDHVDDSHFIGQQGLQPGLWASYNPLMPLNPTSSYPVSASMINHSGAASISSAQGTFAPQIGPHAQADYQAQMSAVDMSFNDMTMAMNEALTQAGNGTVSKVTEASVIRAEYEFNRLDLRLQNQDQYSAQHYSTFTAQIKNIHAKERMRIVEERDMARRKWMQLRASLDEERSVQQRTVPSYLPAPTNHQQTSSMQAMRSASTQKNGNTNFNNSTDFGGNKHFNVQASAWTPKEMNQGSGFPKEQQSAAPYAATASTNHKSAADASNSGSGQLSLATRIKSYPANPLAAEQNMQLVVSSPSNDVPGPYAKQLNDPNDGELSALEVDEWGVRRGRAPPELAAKQTEQDMKLAKIHPDRRSQISFEELDSLPSAIVRLPTKVSLASTKASFPPTKFNSGKTVSFAENNANTTYRVACDCGDGASGAATSKATGWRPMKYGEGPDSEQSDFSALIEASNQEKGVETEVYLVATGDSITVKGKRPPGLPINTANSSKTNDGSRRSRSDMSGQDRDGITKPLMTIEGGVRGWEGARTTASGSSGLGPWARTDENNFFRNKGPSSVAIQSVTAPGTMPGFEGATDRYGQNALKPLPNAGFKLNDGPLQPRSPPKRSLRDIWDAPARRADVEAAAGDKKEMSDVKKGIWKY